jgi:Domain of unknown function (DUF4884)
MKYFLLLLIPVTITGCAYQIPLKKGESENNKTYEVEYLFEHDGCRVYRFYDRGNYVYFTNCRGEAIVKTDSTEVKNKIWR